MTMKSKKNSKQQWLDYEKVVAILEKILTPMAKVEHNILLTVLSRKRKRQCDVVITFQDKSFAIVEVQKRRDKKPDINTFHGWCKKREEVGAKQLICVSALGYPKSIIEDVNLEYGPTVKLLTLSELEKAKVLNVIFPLNFLVYEKPVFSIESFGQLKIENSGSLRELKFSSDDQVFEIEGDTKRSKIHELVSRTLQDVNKMMGKKGIREPKNYKINLILGSAQKCLWIHANNQRLKVIKLPILVNVRLEKIQVPIRCLEYKKIELDDGKLAWIILTEGRAIGKKSISFKLIFKPDNNGFLQLFLVDQIGVELTGVSLKLYSKKSDVISSMRRTVEHS